MAPGAESIEPLAGRLRRVGELLIGLSGSPVPTHVFQILAEQAHAVLPHDYLAACLEDAEQLGYVVHSLAPLSGEAIAFRLFTRDEGLPGRAIRTGRAHLVGELGRITDGAPDLDGVLVRAGLQAALAVPIRRGPEVQGALLFARRSAPYTLDDLEIASLLAAGVSGAFETCRAYQALADERGTLAAVLTSTADAVVMVGQNGLVLLVNPAAHAMLGLTAEGAVGRPFGQALAHEPLRRLFEAWQPGVAELALPDGRVAQASLVFVTTEYGESVGLAAILRDITLLKNLEQMKNDFVNTVSHDLKSPIMAIAMTAELLARTVPSTGADAYRERCQRILRSANQMTALVSDLLDLGKIEAGLEGPGEPLDLVEMVEDAIRAQAAQAESKGIAVSRRAPPAARVVGVRARLAQVLANLVGNAVKYTREGGRVEVVVEAATDDGAPVRLRVVDNGIGIPARDLPHVFDKFYRVRNASTSGISGTGLGLAITRSIVEAHRGRIGVESVEGAGSTFWVELPAAG
ncbi:MAG TPA: GAF domain-containing sensor histidine kinase [Methylomirabilota bacterium]|nr:GAF domain-containing sensor histidine kinase [Methylomirabilota bacterium]